MHSKRRILSEIGSSQPLGVLLFTRNSCIGIEQKVGAKRVALMSRDSGRPKLAAPLRMIAAIRAETVSFLVVVTASIEKESS